MTFMMMVKFFSFEFIIAYNRANKLLGEISSHLTSSIKGSVIQTGIRTVLLGAPNVGKSSLMNILARRPASIVSPEPGTTRDVVEVLLDIAGFPCIVGDTAGLREGADIGEIEREGVRRTKKQAESSDLRIIVVDITLDVQKSLKEVESYYTSESMDVTTVLVLNKIDLADSGADDLKEQYSHATGLSNESIFPISCITKQGLYEFASGMTKILQNMTGSNENILATNERQRKLLTESINCLQMFIGKSPDEKVLI
jgi:tRNA modification GTPase